jgi:hypothetical protein
VREDESRPYVSGKLTQVSVVPGRLDALELWLLASYQPTPKPSPFVVSAPSREWRLWSISEWSGL